MSKPLKLMEKNDGFDLKGEKGGKFLLLGQERKEKDGKTRMASRLS